MIKFSFLHIDSFQVLGDDGVDLAGDHVVAEEFNWKEIR